MGDRPRWGGCGVSDRRGVGRVGIVAEFEAATVGLQPGVTPHHSAVPHVAGAVTLVVFTRPAVRSGWPVVSLPALSPDGQWVGDL